MTRLAAWLFHVTPVWIYSELPVHWRDWMLYGYIECGFDSRFPARTSDDRK